MNFTRHLFSKRTTIAVAFVLLAMLCAVSLTAQVAPSGSVIGNQATATYTDANSVTRTAFSNLVQTTVTQVYKGTLNPNNQRYATPGTQVMFPHVYQNTGNGPDSVTLNTAAIGANLSNVHIYIDANGDGIPDNTTDISGSAQAVAANAYLKVVVVATLNAGAASGGTLQINGTSTGGAGVVTGSNAANNSLDTVVLSANGVIAVTKAMSAAAAGGTSTVTLTYTNTGNNTATAVAITDDLAGQGAYYTYKANSGTWNAASFTDASAPSGLTWAIAGNKVVATVASIAPGVTGTITFQVTVATPSTYPATYSNFATYAYSDGGGNSIPASGTLQTNTVNLAFTGYGSAKFSATAPAGQYTAGTTAGTPPVNSTNDVNAIPSAAYSQGATITWTDVIKNAGQVLDTFNLTVDTAGTGGLNPVIAGANQFPAGTTFQLYRADGKTPLTDSNGDGVVDSGPIAAGSTANIVITATLPAGYTTSSAVNLYVNLIAAPTNSTASNFGVAGTNDVIQNQVAISKTNNNVVDVTTSSTDSGATNGAGTGFSAETNSFAGNPGSTIAIPFYLFNTGVAPDAYSLSFRYNAAGAVGNLSSPLTAFNAAQAGTVPPAVGTIPAWTVLFAPSTGANCATYGAPVTASSVIANASNAAYCLLVQVPGGYSAGAYHFVIQAQSNSSASIDQMAVTATVNTYTSVSISPNNQGTVYAGGTVVYKHVVTNGGNTTVSVQLPTPTFQATPAGWTEAVYYDGTSAGQLTNAATSEVTPYTIASLAPGASQTYFVVVQAPASANPGDTQLLTWGPIVVASNASTSLTVTDTTAVVSGQIKLVKGVYVDTACSSGATYALLNALTPYVFAGTSATSQNCLVYQIQATNVGNTSVTSLVVADTAPPYTTIQGAAIASPAGSGTCSSTSAGVVNSSSPVNVSFATVQPGCAVTVYFKVKLN